MLKNAHTEWKDVQTSAGAHCATSFSSTKLNEGNVCATNWHQATVPNVILMPSIKRDGDTAANGSDYAELRLRLPAPFGAAMLVFASQTAGRFSSSSLRFFSKSTVWWSGDTDFTQWEEERRRELGWGDAGWLLREDRRKGRQTETSASRYVRFLKGNTSSVFIFNSFLLLLFKDADTNEYSHMTACLQSKRNWSIAIARLGHVGQLWSFVLLYQHSAESSFLYGATVLDYSSPPSPSIQIVLFACRHDALSLSFWVFLCS